MDSGRLVLCRREQPRGSSSCVWCETPIEEQVWSLNQFCVKKHLPNGSTLQRTQFCISDHDLLTDFTRVLFGVCGSDVSTKVQELLKLGLALVTTEKDKNFFDAVRFIG